VFVVESVCCVCDLSLCGDRSISFQQLENKVDKSTIDIVTKLQLSETEITRKLDRIENNFQVMNSRFCKTEEDVQQARMWNHRHIAAIDLIVGKLNISMSEKEIRDHLEATAKKEFHIKYFKSTVTISNEKLA
jgi:hypothetical protein